MKPAVTCVTDFDSTPRCVVPMNKSLCIYPSVASQTSNLGHMCVTVRDSTPWGFPRLPGVFALARCTIPCSPCSRFVVKNLGKCPKNALQLKGDDSVDHNSCKHVPSVCRAGIETCIGVDTNHSLFWSAVDMISFIYDLHYL